MYLNLDQLSVLDEVVKMYAEDTYFQSEKPFQRNVFQLIIQSEETYIKIIYVLFEVSNQPIFNILQISPSTEDEYMNSVIDEHNLGV